MAKKKEQQQEREYKFTVAPAQISQEERELRLKAFLNWIFRPVPKDNHND